MLCVILGAVSFLWYNINRVVSKQSNNTEDSLSYDTKETVSKQSIQFYYSRIWLNMWLHYGIVKM